MKLKELLQKVSFDDIIPHIIAWDPEEITQISYYKEAYDILLHTEPTQSNEVIAVEWELDEEELCGEAPYIHISNCEGDDWTNNLGKELVLGKGVEMSDEELAGRCMWSLCYWHRPAADYFNHKPNNHYQNEADKLSDRQFTNYARPKNQKTASQALSLDEWKIYNYREKHRNRIKRMRDHRQEIRIEQLEYMAKVEQATQRILATTDSISREQISYLFDTQLIQEQVAHSRAYNPSRRIDYLWEILTKYTKTDNEPYTRTIAVLSTAPNYPLTATECATFNRIIALFADKTEVLSAVGTKETVGEEAELFIIKSY